MNEEKHDLLGISGPGIVRRVQAGGAAGDNRILCNRVGTCFSACLLKSSFANIHYGYDSRTGSYIWSVCHHSYP